MARRIKSFTDHNSGAHTLNKVINVDVDKICAAYLSENEDTYFWIELEGGNRYLISTQEYNYSEFLAYWKG